MDYQNRAGSKKGGGGIASDSQANLARRKQVDELLRQGQQVPYTFQDEADELNRNPYIYKNHSGKLVCKLCNTIHTAWSSVERHLSGNKHGLNVLRRGSANDKNGGPSKQQEDQDHEFLEAVDSKRRNLRHNGIVPDCKTALVKDKETDQLGIAIQVDYNAEEDSNDEQVISPFIRIVSGLELSESDQNDKKYVVIAYEPFENVAIEIPSDKEIVMNKNYEDRSSLDELNGKCTFWDVDAHKFYVQLFFA
ncbi:ZYRO0B05170p [Zygosaccharomyces rouxii]|uniref:ZYRO0B05170p n=1 Tax=Zygosaccharomyces rouxii (strain ATCC 2623 / CBS 732 / NBRC 1130 / NCYC 568 / NRRL Y-229) TaxID=559307 RepID=C5DR32_ZYGRC|nr:uncharacterized protein ZYRO0B05170g [Zygosaccharomyces rouxii]CAR26243.1 ZYRO0B05170p [Zygosaccharomyces rouxii]